MRPAPIWPQAVQNVIEESFPDGSVRVEVISGINFRVQIAEDDSGSVCFEHSVPIDGSYCQFYAWAWFEKIDNKRVVINAGGSSI